MSRRAGVVLVGVLAAAIMATPGRVSIGAAADLGLVSQALTPYRSCVITGTPASTTTVSDTSVRQANPTANFGTTTTSSVATASGANARLYLLFNLGVCNPAIPSTAVVRLATLRLYLTARPTSCRTVDMFRVTTSWAESGITWNSQPFGTALNSPSSASATDTFTVGAPGGCENRSTGAYIIGANPTADVAAFVAGTATNYGWMLRDDSEGSGMTFTQTYAAKDLGTLALAPQLIVTYVAVP